jgi:isopenicillin-N epimerase
VRELFLLDPEVVFLNHGSFGACPRPVFEEYQRLQQELERQPVEFLARDRRHPELIDAARRALAEYVGAEPENLVFTTNATEALNAVARSLPLERGDEVLAPVGEYGAVDMLWRHVCSRAGAAYVRQPVALRSRPEEALDQLWAAVGDRTRAVVVSHVSCFTGTVFPVADLCSVARERGVLSIVDGAHAPGQIPLRLDSLGADFYAGNCHKWLCAPKGAGFLYVRREHHQLLEPPVISWDWEEEADFAARMRWRGTRDPAAWLAVPAAIDFQEQHDWDEVRTRCHQLAVETRGRLTELLGTELVAPGESSFVQLVGIELPPCDPLEVQKRLREQRIEILGMWLDGVPLLRVSFQGYNDASDADALAAALEALRLTG